MHACARGRAGLRLRTASLSAVLHAWAGHTRARAHKATPAACVSRIRRVPRGIPTRAAPPPGPSLPIPPQVDPDRPLVAVVSRLVPQKGIHLIKAAIARTVEQGGQVLGAVRGAGGALSMGMWSRAGS
jgi:hypothetical protein